MATLSFKIYNSPTCTKLLLDDIDLSIDVKALRKKIATLNQDVNNLNFIYSGKVLKDDETLKDLGISQDSLIYCTPKCDAVTPAACPSSFMETQQLMTSLRLAVRSNHFRSAIHRLRSIEQVESLISECPSLRRDPSALAFAQDPDLICSLLNGNFDKYIDDRPVLGRLLQIVVTVINSEISSNRSHDVSYSLDALVEEDMDTEQNLNGSASSSRPPEPSSFNMITADQLRAALASAAGSGIQGSSSSRQSGATTPSSLATPSNTPAPNSGSLAGGASPRGQLITSEMFNQALQNALATSTPSNSDRLPNQAAASSIAAAPASIDNLEESLQLMREMGIVDQDLCIRALQATNGDVQAAVNLIFAQWMTDDGSF